MNPDSSPAGSLNPARAILVGVAIGRCPQFDDTLDELALLAESAGDLPVARVIARRKSPDPALFIGTGKADEIKALVALHQAEVQLLLRHERHALAAAVPVLDLLPQLGGVDGELQRGAVLPLVEVGIGDRARVLGREALLGIPFAHACAPWLCLGTLYRTASRHHGGNNRRFFPNSCWNCESRT